MRSAAMAHYFITAELAKLLCHLAILHAVPIWMRVSTHNGDESSAIGCKKSEEVGSLLKPLGCGAARWVYGA